MRLLDLLLVATLCTSVHAFSKATGSCAAGSAAINGGPHLIADSLKTGTLATGGFSVKLGSTKLSTATTTTSTFTVGVSTTLTISGTKAFTGFFARLGEIGGVQTDTAFTGTGDVQVPKLCTVAGVGGICQTSASKKTSVTATLKLGSAAASMPLDVIIVVSGNSTNSEYYYTQYKISAVAAKVPTKVPTKKPTLRPTVKK